MKLIEALQITQRRPQGSDDEFRIYLSCGFTPLHFQTFLNAHTRAVLSRAVSVSAGLYGDLTGNLDRMPDGTDAVVVAIEWADLDPRLGVRTLGGWSASSLGDVLGSATAQLDRIAKAVARLRVSVAISVPTLPLPPIPYGPPRIASVFETELDALLAEFGRAVTRNTHVSLVNRRYLDRVSPPAERFDFNGDLQTGFPYQQAHADKLAECIAQMLTPRTPKKGLITDLDDTLWLGIVGEVGTNGVCWGIDQKGLIHGLYQQLLSSLSSTGTLLGVASKNTPAIVDKVLQRPDLLLQKDAIFPLDIHWGAKSESIARILRTWNIGPDAVVFIDDSPMEVAEVQTAFPDIECIVFPKNDARALWDLLFHLRERFGKQSISEEDDLRLSSIRTGVLAAEERTSAADLNEFLARAEAEVTIDTRNPLAERTLELITKTNQFNLNGKRATASEWATFCEQPGAFVANVSYRDRFGPLGAIAVLAGTAQNGSINVDYWVMSCRAFSRRIEHQCLAWLFRRFSASQISLRFASTARNTPLQEFLTTLTGSLSSGDLRLSRETFEASCPPLFHLVHET